MKLINRNKDNPIRKYIFHPLKNVIDKAIIKLGSMDKNIVIRLTYITLLMMFMIVFLCSALNIAKFIRLYNFDIENINATISEIVNIIINHEKKSVLIMSFALIASILYIFRIVNIQNKINSFHKRDKSEKNNCVNSVSFIS